MTPRRFGKRRIKPREQARVLHLLIDHIHIDYDGEAGEVTITFHPAGLSSLAHEVKASRQATRRECRRNAEKGVMNEPLPKVSTMPGSPRAAASEFCC